MDVYVMYANAADEMPKAFIGEEEISAQEFEARTGETLAETKAYMDAYLAAIQRAA